MKKYKQRNLFYKKKSQTRLAIIAVLAVTALLGTAVLALGTPSEEATGSSETSYAVSSTSAETHDASIFSTIISKVRSVANKNSSLLNYINETAHADTISVASGNRASITPLIKRSTVTITADGNNKSVSFIGKPTVQDIIRKAGITLSDLDIVSKDLTGSLRSGESIKITRVEIVEEEEVSESEYETIYEDDESMTEGETEIKQEGQNRIEKSIFEVTYHDGEVAEKSLKSTEIIQEGQNEIILVGTSPEESSSNDNSGSESNDGGSSDSSNSDSSSSDSSGSSDSSSSNSSNSDEGFSYSSVITCTAYAYVAGGYGASGNPAVVGTCAVDPSVIPLGTRLYIDGYGYAIANDTGGGIKGYTVDLVMNTAAECYQWGRRTVNVYILD